MRLFTSGLLNLLQTATKPKQIKKKSEKRSYTPWLESLEDRRVLSITFTQVPGVQTNFEGAQITTTTGIRVQAVEAGQTISYSATGLPAGLSVDSSTGFITGLIDLNADTGSPYTVQLTATDALSGPSTQTFTWNVNDDPITFTNPGPQTNFDGATINLVLGSSNTQGHPLTFTASGLPAGLSINGTTGVITGVVGATADTSSPYTVHITATDATANASNSETFIWNVAPAPITVTTPAAQTSKDGATINLPVVAVDSLGHTLVYSANNLPGGLTIASNTGVISGVISDTAHTGSPFGVTVTATDVTSNASVSKTFAWTVTAGTVTVLNPGNQISAGLQKINLKVNAFNSVTANKLTFTATGLPAGLTINANTGVISGTIAFNANSTTPYSVKVTARDVAANTSQSQTFTWTVSPGPITGIVFFDSNGNGSLDGTDPRLAGVKVTLTGTTTQSTPVNLTATTDANGRFTFVNPPAGTYTVKVGAVAALQNRKANIGQLISSPTINVTNGSPAVATAVKGGLGTSFISINQFLTSTKLLNQPYGPVGTGLSVVNHAPTLSKTLSTVALNSTTTTSTVDLAGNFSDADFANSSVTLHITNGTTPSTINVTLFDAKAPQTVANFLGYVKAHQYDNSIFNRLVKDFVLQGGGATINAAGTSITSIPIGPKVPNEFGTPNTKGTIAMAQSGSDINSATDQFFFNTVDNSKGKPNDLDTRKFTVFGKVDADSEAALATLAATGTLNASGSTAATANPTVDLNNIPLTGYTGGTSTATSSTFASDAHANNFMTVNSVTINKNPEFLTYSVSSSNTTIVTATLDSVHGEQLKLTRGTSTGTATITVVATDRFGLSVTSTFTVTVS